MNIKTINNVEDFLKEMKKHNAISKERYATSPEVQATVSTVIKDVAKRGDVAVREYTEKWDGCKLDSFEVPKEAIDAAMRDVDSELIGVMQRAAKNIEDFHRHQIRDGFTIDKGDIILGQKITPLKRVGVCVPGFLGVMPSSVLMNCIPAKLAGVSEIIVATAPGKDGSVSQVTLAAARIAGADRVFSVAGAQAAAALAFGTETIPAVDKITGPGNVYLQEAKRQLFGVVGIDMIAGPSDILVIADEIADPKLVAADLLSQCEHGVDSIAVLVTNSSKIANDVRVEIERQIPALSRADFAETSVKNNCKFFITKSIEDAFVISNELAPEHLEIFLDEPMKYLDLVTNAGSVFLGKYAPEALGDYYAGTNHILPTSGTARFSSPLSVDDFIKKTSFTYYSKDELNNIADDVVKFAMAEGLDAHALSVSKRIK